MPNITDNIRSNLKEKLIDFVRYNQGTNKILLIKHPPGVGKTVTGSISLFGRGDFLTVWLSPRHNQIEDVILEHNEIFHLKGRKKLYKNPLFQELEKYKASITDILCKTNCEIFKNKTCEYFNQFKELKKDPEPFVCVHHHLNIDFINEFLKTNHGFPFKCLVIDENPTKNLTRKGKFNTRNLIEFMKILGEISWII